MTSILLILHLIFLVWRIFNFNSGLLLYTATPNLNHGSAIAGHVGMLYVLRPRW